MKTETIEQLTVIDGALVYKPMTIKTTELKDAAVIWSVVCQGKNGKPYIDRTYLTYEAAANHAKRMTRLYNNSEKYSVICSNFWGE